MATSVVLHIVLAEYDTGVCNAIKVDWLIYNAEDRSNDIRTKYCRKDFYNTRFITHLEFLGQRIFTGQMQESVDYGFARSLLECTR